MHKRLTLAVTATAALALPAAAAAQTPTATRYQRDYHAVAAKFGVRAPGRNILRWGLPSGARPSTARLMQSIGVLERMLHPAPAPTSTSTTATPVSYTGGGLADVPGVPEWFASCVALHESSDGTTSSDVYGIIPQSGYDVYGDSIAQQKVVFAELYAQVGVSGWAPWDGC